MPIKLIACVTTFKNKLAIGKSNGLLFNIKEDLELFKTITKDQLCTESRLKKNVVVMGRKTWYSIPASQRPLKDRINIVLTNDTELHKLSPFPLAGYFTLANKSLLDINKLFNEDVYFLTFDQFQRFYKLTDKTANTHVIGGAEIYNVFLNHPKLVPTTVYLTEVTGKSWQNMVDQPDTFMQPLDNRYKLIGISERKYDTKSKVSYRFLTYKCQDKGQDHPETRYLDLCSDILQNGNARMDRTQVGTKSVFGRQLHFDISDFVPLLSTKRVPWKHAIQELLWFMRGDTDAKILQRDGVKIWDGNTSREFLDNRGLHHYPEGVLGAGYGWQWRFFGAKYSHAFADTSQLDKSKIGGFDQLEYIISELRNNPYGRRALMCYWNPPDFEKTALVPCHFSCQFYVRQCGETRYLDCHFTMRSTDVFLGLPFNLFSYSVMTYIIALKCDMKPGKLVYSGGDVHIYNNHVQQVQEQLTRQSRPFPKLVIDASVKSKDFSEITVDDFDIVGYFPHPPIKAPMAV